MRFPPIHHEQSLGREGCRGGYSIGATCLVWGLYERRDREVGARRRGLSSNWSCQLWPPGRAAPARLRGQQSESGAQTLARIRARCSCPITSRPFLRRAWAHSSGQPTGIFHDFTNCSLPSSSLAPRPQAPLPAPPVLFFSSLQPVLLPLGAQTRLLTPDSGPR